MEFQKFDKIPRLSREMLITEKIDGTNAQIMIVNKYNYFKEGWVYDIEKNIIYSNEEFYVLAGSRKRWLDFSSKGDNHGFAKWVKENAIELLKLGEGRHYGEWYGKGIRRGYELDEKRFALFNVKKWEDPEIRPKCCWIVPTLFKGDFNTEYINKNLEALKRSGSLIAPGFMNPEGIVIYHKASGQLFKKTILNDEKPKGIE